MIKFTDNPLHYLWEDGGRGFLIPNLSKLELKTIQDFSQPKFVKHQEMTEKDG